MTRFLSAGLHQARALALACCCCFAAGGLAATLVVTTTSDSGAGSLRQAIIDANNTPGPDLIQFSIAGSGVKTIALASTLPVISDPVTIDGTSQLGYAGLPLIELNGTGAGQNAALRVYSGPTTIRGLAINRFDAQGILLQGSASNQVSGNFIGTSAAGMAISANTAEGIWVNGSSWNVVGGTGTWDRNVISGNKGEAGLYILNGSSNIVQGNLIGLNVLGTGALTNAKHGIVINGSGANLIGGAESGDGNMISGNTESGIYITGSASLGNRVQGNTIGLATNGIAVVSNGADGISIASAPGNLIGGTNSGMGNVISGNGGAGVYISGSTSRSNQLCGNLIGTDGTGELALGNGKAGVTISSAYKSQIGGAEPGAGNVISGNDQDGVFLSTNSNGSILLGNIIGLDGTGTKPLGNGWNGLVADSCHSNIIGMAQARNLVSGNGANGIQFRYGSSNNVVEGNFVGLDVTGGVPQANGASPAWTNLGFGIWLSAARNNTVRGNVISGNMQAGVGLASGAVQNQLLGNKIGTDWSGLVIVSNYCEGIYMANCSSNAIGGPNLSDGNVISGNGTWGISMTNSWKNTFQGNLVGVGADGTTPMGTATRAGSARFHLVELMSGARANSFIGNTLAYAPSLGADGYSGIRIRDGATNNTISANSFFANAGLGIDLGAYKVTLNDPCDTDSGANLQQNFPVLTQTVTGNGTGVRGYLDSQSGVAHHLEFFGSPYPHPWGYGEGMIYLGSLELAAMTRCTNSFVVSLPITLPAGYVITATATDDAGNTSEFSACSISTAVPALSVTRPSSGGYRLAWPSTSTGFVLQQATDMTPPVVWSPVTNAVTSGNGEYVVNITDTGFRQFFRLSFE